MLLFSMVENEKDLSKFQRIYDQYKNMMYWVAYDITKNTHDAEDVVQLSLIKLIDILYRIEEEEIGRSRCKNLSQKTPLSIIYAKPVMRQSLLKQLKNQIPAGVRRISTSRRRTIKS